MKSTPFILFLTSKSVMDLALITLDQSAVCVTVEHTYTNIQTKLGVKTETTIWSFWTPDPQHEAVQPLSRCSVALPVAQAADLAMESNQIWGLFEVNNRSAAVLMRWKITSPSMENVTLESVSSFPVALDSPQAGQVNIPLQFEWSAPSLPCAQWLFYPALAIVPGAARACVALNTADAHAVLWESDDAGKPAKVTAFLPDRLEPSWHRADGRTLLFFRQCPPGWSVYFHHTRYSGQYGPVALPLLVSELDPEGKPGKTLDLSKEAGLGEVFAYHVCCGENNEMALAAVSGSKTAPILNVLVSEDAGRSFQVKYNAPLPQMPRRLRIARSKTGFAIGAMFLGARGYEAQCMTLEN